MAEWSKAVVLKTILFKLNNEIKFKLVCIIINFFINMVLSCYYYNEIWQYITIPIQSCEPIINLVFHNMFEYL